MLEGCSTSSQTYSFFCTAAKLSWLREDPNLRFGAVVKKSTIFSLKWLNFPFIYLFFEGFLLDFLLFLGLSSTVPLTFFSSFAMQREGEKVTWPQIEKSFIFKADFPIFPIISQENEENIKRSKCDLVFKYVIILFICPVDID